MELLLDLAMVFGAFSLGVVWKSKVLPRFRRKPKLTIALQPTKPKNEFSNYTIEELEAHKRYREVQYQQSVNYPALRSGHAEALKKVLEMLDYHYTLDGTYALRAQREQNRRELAAFDEQYSAILRGED